MTPFTGSINKGDVVRYHDPNDKWKIAEAVCISTGWKNGEGIVNLDNGYWVYRRQVLAIRPAQNQDVIGLEANGSVIQMSSEGPFTTSENLMDWGLHNLTEKEVQHLLSLDGLRPIDRAFLEAWKPGMTAEEGRAISEQFHI